MKSMYEVLRVFPKTRTKRGREVPIPNTVNTVFLECQGSFKECMKYCKGAAKPHLVLVRKEPVIVWDVHGNMKDLRK